jgi:uncharacterized membrane protein YhaH (DUF805 family)
MIFKYLLLKSFATLGRANIKDFLYFNVLYILIYLILIGLNIILEENNIDIGIFLAIPYSFIFIVYVISFFNICIRRLHDCGHSGMWVLLMLPLNIFLLLYLLFVVGDKEENKFGVPREN